MVASRDTFIVLTTLLSILLLGTPVHTVSSKEITSHTYSEHTAIAVASPITHLIAPRSRVRNFTGCEQYRSLIQEHPSFALETAHSDLAFKHRLPKKSCLLRCCVLVPGRNCILLMGEYVRD